ncbi:hypothetical protein EJ06DRAFT_497118 [Trichodelitschia bisporula]|uniref:Sterol 24-C-methyltransferase n=1 Tax=Trichodelitschia bisporula TaxID=703511 RepID=A0A6G1HQV1_9PEZI|nr:hypothetical protein EJ06DRAFT_497118 [Trichodelitschia bisporula]
MAPVALEKQDLVRDKDFMKAMHGTSSESTGGIKAMMGKNNAAQKEAVAEYFKHWDNNPTEETEGTRAARRAEYATLTRHYYNLATDLYEYGWGTSFHFSRFAYGESFRQSIARHEHYLAHMMGLREGMKVLDVGCGVGGPAREIAKFAGVDIVGINNNDYQIERATRYARKEGFTPKQMSFVKGDFCQLPFPDNSFDAVYAIEATVHAPSLEAVYSEICRVLKPGGVFGCYEWLMTHRFDESNAEHQAIRRGIELGDGISNMDTVDVALKAVEDSGFTLEHHEDLAERVDGDYAPWYWPIAGELRYASGIMDVITTLRMTKPARFVIHNLLGLAEKVYLIPSGTARTANALGVAADCLSEGGRQRLFTPMYLLVGRKKPVA